MKLSWTKEPPKNPGWYWRSDVDYPVFVSQNDIDSGYYLDFPEGYDHWFYWADIPKRPYCVYYHPQRDNLCE